MNGKRNTAVIFVILCLSCFQAFSNTNISSKMTPNKSIELKGSFYSEEINTETKINKSASHIHLNENTESDSLALVALYEATGGPNWTNIWKLENPMNEWYGVTIIEGSVFSIDLISNNLDGEIPPEIGNLSNLQELRLGNNLLKGEIPTNLFALGDLRVLALPMNQLEGNIPQHIRYLTSLTHLNLAINAFDGEIPYEIYDLPNLIDINLAVNIITGTIPPEVGNLTNLESLNLIYTGTTGVLPAELGTLNNLTTLQLHNTYIHGCYPITLKNLCEQITHSPDNVSNNTDLDVSWESFCNNNDGICPGVWPGDTDNNGIVEKEDLLYWGLAAGNQGPARPNPSNLWEAQDCTDWESSVNEINGKHQDANGDNIVDINDIDVITQNYGENLGSSVTNFLSNSNAQFTLIPDDNNPLDDNMITFDLVAYSTDGGPLNLHGLSCTIDMSLSGVVDASFILNQLIDNDYESIDIFNSNTNNLTPNSTLDIAVTRFDQVNQNIDGATIGTMIVVVEQGFDGGVFMTIGDGSTIQNDGTLGGNSGPISFQQNPIPLDRKVDVPIISANIAHANCSYSGAIQLYITGGTPPYTIQWEGLLETTTQITNLQPGIYPTTVTDDNGQISTMQIEVEAHYELTYDEEGNPVECDPQELPPNDDRKREGMDNNAYLQQNHPNPFSQTTTIPYDIPEDAKNPVLNIFDVTGNLKYTVPVTQTGEGGIQISEHRLPTGIYYYQLKMDERISTTRKMIIVSERN